MIHAEICSWENRPAGVGVRREKAATALGLSLCRELAVSQAANLLRVAAKRLWTRIGHYVEAVRAQDDMSGVRVVGIDETSGKNPEGWSREQFNTMHGLRRSNLKSARAWRLKQTLRQVYAQAVSSNSESLAREALGKWLSWARRCRLESFKRLATTVRDHLQGVVRGMLDGRSNAAEAMNGLLQQTKTAARGFRTVENFIAIAYLRMSKLKHMLQSAAGAPRTWA